MGEVSEALVHGAVEIAEGSGERVRGDGGESEFVGDAEDVCGALCEGAAECVEVGDGLAGWIGCEESGKPEGHAVDEDEGVAEAFDGFTEVCVRGFVGGP